jgi:hypothetical protein
MPIDPSFHRLIYRLLQREYSPVYIKYLLRLSVPPDKVMQAVDEIRPTIPPKICPCCGVIMT